MNPVTHVKNLAAGQGGGAAGRTHILPCARTGRGSSPWSGPIEEKVVSQVVALCIFLFLVPLYFSLYL